MDIVIRQGGDCDGWSFVVPSFGEYSLDEFFGLELGGYFAVVLDHVHEFLSDVIGVG